MPEAFPLANLVFSTDDPKLTLKDLPGCGPVSSAAAIRHIARRFRSAAFWREPAVDWLSMPIPIVSARTTLPRKRSSQRLERQRDLAPLATCGLGDMMPMVPVNSVVSDVKQLGDVPIRSDGPRTIFHS